MREWVSAAEIAKMKLPGFPGSKRGVNLMASRYFWPSRDRNAIGGGREYSVSALLKILPDKARDALLAQIADTASASASLPAPASLPMPISAKAIAACAPVAPVTLADWQRRCADARAALLLEVDRLAAMVGINRAILTMVELAASGQLRPDLQALVPYANARSAKDGARTLSRRSLYRWRDDAKAGIAALAPLGLDHTTVLHAVRKVAGWSGALAEKRDDFLAEMRAASATIRSDTHTEDGGITP